MSELTYARVERALTYLAETDELFAKAKADVERSKHKAKAVFAAMFARNMGTVKERECEAEMHPQYQEALEDHFKAVEEYEFLRNKRNLEELVIEVWRSVNSARNKGQIV